MVIDTSAFVAILTGEPERRRFIDAIESAESRLVSAATFGRDVHRDRIAVWR